MKRTLLTLAAGVAFGAAAVAAPALSSRQVGNVDVRPGTFVHWIGLDWSCSGGSRDPDRNDPGPYIYCSRFSTQKSRAISVSRYHIAVTDRTGGYTVYKVSRSP